jgi:hypothetical protein
MSRTPNPGGPGRHTPPVSPTDLRQAAASLEARADGILARLSRDTILREQAEQEAIRCRRLAERFVKAAKGRRPPNRTSRKGGRT